MKVLESCKVEITTATTSPFTICSSVLMTSYTILRITIAIIGFLLGILTVIKFRKYLKQNTWSKLRTKRERTLIIQVNICYRLDLDFSDVLDFWRFFDILDSFDFLYFLPNLYFRLSVI